MMTRDLVGVSAFFTRRYSPVRARPSGMMKLSSPRMRASCFVKTDSDCSSPASQGVTKLTGYTIFRGCTMTFLHRLCRAFPARAEDLGLGNLVARSIPSRVRPMRLLHVLRIGFFVY